MSETNLLPAGRYRAVGVLMTTDNGRTYCQFGKTQGGSPQVCVNFEILEGEQMGRRIAWFGFFTEKTTQRTIEALRYCGFKGNDLAELETQALDNEVEIIVQHEEYQGKWRARVAWVNQVGGGGFKFAKAMDRSGIRAFAAQMRTAVGSVPEAAGKKAERQPPPPQRSREEDYGAPPSTDADGRSPPAADDDIPF